MGKWKYVRTHRNGDDTKFKEALYNLNEDMAEKTDLAKSNPDQLRKMGDLMHQWETELSRQQYHSLPNRIKRKQDRKTPHHEPPAQKNDPSDNPMTIRQFGTSTRLHHKLNSRSLH